MTTRISGALGLLAVLSLIAAVVALTAQAGTATHSSSPRAVLHAVDGDEIHGAVSFVPVPISNGTTAAVTIHGLPPNARIDVRLHTGRSLERLSSTSTALPSGVSAASGSFRAYGRVVSRHGDDVRITDVTDGAHMVLVYANESLVAYTHVPRP